MNKLEILKKLDELRAMIDELEENKVEPEYLNELYTFEELQELAKSREADKKISIGDQLKVDRNGKDIIFDVVKITNSKIYLLSHYLIAEMPFDASEPENSDENIAVCGSNNYLTSSVRQWLNHSETDGEWWAPQTASDRPIACKDYLNGFMYKMNPEFLNCVAKDKNGDTFFLPSEDEIKEWFPNGADRVKTYANKKEDWYWLRTPTSGYSGYVRHVNTSGTLSDDSAYNANGIAPACIIFADLRKSFDEAADRVADALTATDILPKAEYINDMYSYDEIADFAKNGKIEEHFSVGDKIKVNRGEDKSVIFDVIKTSPYGMCLITHDLVAQMPFDAPEPKNPDSDIANYGSNDYLNSSIRQWINFSDKYGEWWSPQTEYDVPIASVDYLNGFLCDMDIKFINILYRNEYGDIFFLLSEDEIKEWLPNAGDRVKSYANGEKDWYWLRTPYSGNSNYVRSVSTSGPLNNNYACNASGTAPACIIGNL